MLNLRTFALLAILAVAAAAITIAPAASAKGGRGVTVSGACSKASSSKLKLSREDAGLEVEFEVDQNRNGVPWKVTLHRNGSLVTSTTRTTHAPSGSFSLHRTIAGAGTIVATATRAGERCTAHASL
jgi:hypothetical protein